MSVCPSENGKGRIDGLHLLAHLCWNGGGVEMPAQKYGQAFSAGLIEVQVDFRNARLRERFRPCVGDDTDNGNPGSARAVSLEALAQGVLVRPKRPGEGLIDHPRLAEPASLSEPLNKRPRSSGIPSK